LRQAINKKKNNSHNFSTGILVFEDGTSFSGNGIGHEVLLLEKFALILQ